MTKVDKLAAAMEGRGRSKIPRMASAAAAGLVLVMAASGATAGPAGPIRVTIECESFGRTKTCPAFLLGILDANKVLLSAPRAAADVVVYVSAVEVALVDRVHMRFVGSLAGAPPVVEVDVEIDTRADDDAQRGQLEPAFLRGIALFVASRHPAGVTVALVAPEAKAVVAPRMTPWGVGLTLGGFASYTDKYRSYNGWSELELSRLDRRSRFEASLSGGGGVSRQPPLEIDDGMGNVTKVSLDTEQWSTAASAEAAWLFNRWWSAGASTRAWREDPKSQFRHGWNARAGIEWDKYQADDPRGNRLAVLYAAGYQVERYNLRNELGESFAHFPIHAIIASGTVRKDRIGVGISLSVGGEMIHPERRHSMSASPFVEWKIGNHVDLHLNVSATKRELPGPHPDEIDPTDYAQSTRLSFAEPFAMQASFSIQIHRDRTNGARNDRLSNL